MRSKDRLHIGQAISGVNGRAGRGHIEKRVGGTADYKLQTITDAPFGVTVRKRNSYALFERQRIENCQQLLIVYICIISNITECFPTIENA